MWCSEYPLFCCSPLKYALKICHYKSILYFHSTLCMILKGYLGGILRKLPSVIPNGPLKDSVAAYLDSIWKKEHLYGSDLREALIEVAHLFVSSNVSNVGTSLQCTVGKYINSLVQISKIRTPKECLQFYNCAFIVHQLLSCFAWSWSSSA